jgi:hypothetical protein
MKFRLSSGKTTLSTHRSHFCCIVLPNHVRRWVRSCSILTAFHAFLEVRVLRVIVGVWAEQMAAIVQIWQSNWGTKQWEEALLAGRGQETRWNSGH